ncbi:MAG: tetratricopeptide repeat protein [Byssovorax sp.]
MRPLDPLSPLSPIVRLLRQAPAAEVRAELDRLGALALDPLPAAALLFARGAFSLREGALNPAEASLSAAAAALEPTGEREAHLLARCEALLATIRRGPRKVYAPSMAALDAILAEATEAGLERAAVVALHYRGTAERLSGDALATQRTLLDAFRRAERLSESGQAAGGSVLLEERAQILNSLGTLYVVLGAYGAAQALLEHAAELGHQIGDTVGEAIAHGQLGSAALALGDLERARRHLQKQEWLASRIGDAFGRSRALTFLADVALELRRSDEAAELAGLAIAAAKSVTPPLALWIAYATRALGRARMEMGDLTGARGHLGAALTQFSQFGNPLGAALTQWDLANLTALEGGAPDWFAPAWALGALGLPARVARLFADRAAQSQGGLDALPQAAVSQAAPQLAVAQELSLVYGAPEELSRIAARRTAGQRNLGRLAALSLAPPGLFVAAIASDAIGGRKRALPPERAAAAALCEIPGAAVWAFPLAVKPEEIGRDLAALVASLGEGARAVLVKAPDARVLEPAFLGEVTTATEGVPAASLIERARALPPGSLQRDEDVPWSPDAEALVLMSGLASAQPAPR